MTTQGMTYLVIGPDGSGKSSFINLLTGAKLKSTFIAESQKTVLELIDKNEGLEINQKNEEFKTIVQKHQNYYEIPVHLKYHEEKSLLYFSLIKKKSDRIVILYLIPYKQENLVVKIQEMLNYFKKIFMTENIFEDYMKKIQIVFTKIWEHDKQIVKQTMDILKLGQLKLNYVTQDGKISGNFQSVQGIPRKTFNFVILSNLLGIRYYFTNSFLHQPWTIEQIIEEFEFFETMKDQHDPISDEQYIRFLKRVCYEAKGYFYKNSLKEMNQLLDFLEKEFSYFKYKDYDLFLQYMDVINLLNSKKQQQYQQEQNSMQIQKQDSYYEEEERQKEFKKLETKLEKISFLAGENRFLIIEIKKHLDLLKTNVLSEDQILVLNKQIENLNSNSESIQNDNQNISQVINDLNENQGLEFFRKNSRQEEKNIEISKNSQISVKDELNEYKKDMSNGQIEVFIAINNVDLEAFKKLILLMPRFHHLKIDQLTIFDILQKKQLKDFISFLKEHIRNVFKSSIHKYASFHKVDRFRALLFAGDHINQKDNNGRTPLFYAVQKSGTFMLKILLENGADINMKDKQGVTPLIWSVKYPFLENVNFLLENGAYLEDKTESGMTALMWASNNGFFEIVKFLVEKGAKIDSMDNNERTALSLAVSKNHLQIVNYLQTVGKEDK